MPSKKKKKTLDDVLNELRKHAGPKPIAPRRFLVDLLTEHYKAEMPGLANKLMDRLVEKVGDQSPIVTLAAEMAQSWVDDHGPAAADALLQTLGRALGGDEDALASLSSEASAAHLTRLTDLLQSEEAASKERGKVWAQRLGLSLGSFAKLASRAALRAAL